MLVHAATENVRTAAASFRGIAILHRSQLEHVEVPGGVIDVEAVIDKLGAVALVDLAPHHIGQAHLPTVHFGEGQRQAALSLVAGVIDDDDMTAAVFAGPGIGDEAIRGPVVGPSELRLDRRPYRSKSV